uniref:Peptidase S1 domain-containing protein n=1 Tax=Timema genevievae TaxID=629358 RepID=A0A7R9JRK5_TIMGE|nr:unnamed protein product [Timema genevievae]
MDVVGDVPNAMMTSMTTACEQTSHRTNKSNGEGSNQFKKCGFVDVQPTPLITKGQKTSRGQWPWHTALYQSKGIDLSYICGGSLISSKAVITGLRSVQPEWGVEARHILDQSVKAAHCVTRLVADQPVDPDTLVVYLGKYHLKLWSEGGVQDKQVSKVHVHPSYNSSDFRADLAILMLSSPVEFTMYVRPVCLWSPSFTELKVVEGKDGTVIGWGYDEFGQVTEELMMATMPIVSQQTCLWSYPQFFSHFTSNKTYCAGFREDIKFLVAMDNPKRQAVLIKFFSKKSKTEERRQDEQAYAMVTVEGAWFSPYVSQMAQISGILGGSSALVFHKKTNGFVTLVTTLCSQTLPNIWNGYKGS